MYWKILNDFLSFCFCHHLFSSAEKRKDFERRRKLHYNEFEAVLRARELMEQDEDGENDANEQIEIDEPSQSAK